MQVGDAVLVDGFLAGPRSLGRLPGATAASPRTRSPPPRRCTRSRAASRSTRRATCSATTRPRTTASSRAGGSRAGETVLVHGASGSTGLAAVHVAKLLGATVIATGRSDAKLAVVREQGADHVVNCGQRRRQSAGVRAFRDEVKALTGGRGVDVVYDGVGGDISLESLRCVRFGARYLIVGWAATPFVARGKGQRGAPNANQLPTNLIMMKGLDVLGCPTVISTVERSVAPRAAARAGPALGRGGAARPHVSHTFPLADVQGGDAGQVERRGRRRGGAPPRGGRGGGLRVHHRVAPPPRFRNWPIRRDQWLNPMRQTALSQPPRPPCSSPAPPPHEELARSSDVPRQSLTRLIAAPPADGAPGHHGSPAHTRPTTPVPSDYLFLAQHRPDEMYAAILAGRLEGLAEEAHDGHDAQDPAEGATPDECALWGFEEITQTRMKTVVPDGSSPPARPGAASAGSAGSMFSLLASVSLVPFLRRAPGDIPRGTIDHRQASSWPSSTAARPSSKSSTRRRCRSRACSGS